MFKYCGRCNTVVPANEYAKHVDGHRRAPAGWQKLRQVVLARDDHRCQVCGLATDLEVHHLDGDWRNNALSNLETRCLPHNPRGPSV